MGKETGITWCDHTFNPWIGCTKVSPGCKHCYAAALTNARPALVLGPGVPRTDETGRLPLWGDAAPRRVTSAENWKQPPRWNRAAAKAGVRRRVFCASLADVFEDWDGQPQGEHPWPSLDDVRTALWALIEQTPHLDWLILTKRPQNVLRMVPATWISDPPQEAFLTDRWPRNAWIGTTMEDQQRADERLERLRQIPAAVRFISYEPALEAVRFDLTGIDWLIVGGESGAGARPFDLAWARSAVEQCKAAGVACFVKQMGARPVWGDRKRIACIKEPAGLCGTPQWCAEKGLCCSGVLRDRAGADPAEWPEDLRVQEWPRTCAAGWLLDGVEHSEIPVVGEGALP